MTSCIDRSRRWLRTLALLALAAAVLLTVAACGRFNRPQETPANETPVTTEPATPSTPTATEPTPTAPATTTPPPVTYTTARVYFSRGEFLGVGSLRKVVAASPAKAAMTQLLAGPTSAEKAWGLGTTIPSGTKLLGIKISGGVATVDLSKRFESGGGTLSMTLRIAQVVNTLTQFKGVKTVAFRLDGKKATSIGGEGLIVWPPVDRADYDGALPAIMLESPAPGATITSPVRLTGSANVFEAVFRVKITDAAGKIVADKPVKATSGTGTRGTFDASIKFTATKHGKGWLTVYEPSAKDGSPTNVVKIRVYL